MKRIALTMRITNAPNYDEPRDSISHDWLNRLRAWDMTPMPIANLGDDVVAVLDGLAPDALILTGGDDFGVTPQRDATETALLRHALASSLPVLGVCRGLQLINAHFGGRVTSLEGHVGASHPVNVAEPWRRHYGETATVNSFHELGIPADGVATELAVAAVDAGGHVEGVYHPEKRLAAVMWHPERPGAPDGDRLLLAGLAEGVPPWR